MAPAPVCALPLDGHLGQVDVDIALDQVFDARGEGGSASHRTRARAVNRLPRTGGWSGPVAHWSWRSGTWARGTPPGWHRDRASLSHSSRSVAGAIAWVRR